MMTDAPTIDRYVRENLHGLAAFHDTGESEWNGVDGRTLHAFARRGLVWFECVDPWAKHKRYRGGLTTKGRQVLAMLESSNREPCTCGVAWGTAEGPCVCEPSLTD